MLAILLAASAAARADEIGAGQSSSEPAAPAAAPSESWYGWQTFLVDASAVGIPLLIYNAGGKAAAAPVGVAIYALGAPLVHWGHGETRAAWSSISLRLGLPIAMAGIGGVMGGMSSCNTQATFVNICAFSGAIVGGVAGIAAAIFADTAFLSWKKTDAQPRPFVVVDLRRGLVGVGGSF